MVLGHSETAERLIRLLDRLTEICRRDFSGLSAVQLSWKSLPEKWSVSECLQHIILIAESSIPGIGKCIENALSPGTEPENYNSGKFGRILIESVRIREDNSIRKIGKCPSKLRPEKYSDLRGDMLMNHFFSVISKLTELLERSKKIDLIYNRVQLPRFPYFRLRLGDMFLYTVHHIERHVVQAQKVLMEDNFPRQGAY